MARVRDPNGLEWVILTSEMPQKMNGGIAARSFANKYVSVATESWQEMLLEHTAPLSAIIIRHEGNNFVFVSENNEVMLVDTLTLHNGVRGNRPFKRQELCLAFGAPKRVGTVSGSFHQMNWQA